MSFSRMLRYHYYSFRYPELREYVDMGLGIEARRERCVSLWEKHLAYSKEFQQKYLGSGETLLVFGAGRLLDIDPRFLSSAFQRVYLFDADPSAQPFWRAHFPEAEGAVADISGGVLRWKRALRKFFAATRKGSFISLIDFLEGLELHLPELPKAEAVLSTNILSQLGIYWRDNVAASLKKKWSFETNEQGQYPEEIEEALFRSVKRLQEGHLELLRRLNPARMSLISDTHFHFYRNDRAEWLTEEALAVNIHEIPGFRVIGNESWLWHLAPQGIEDPNYGVIHRVEAIAYERR